MYNWSKNTKSSPSERSQRRKKKLKKNNFKKTNVTTDEWAYLEWTCVDSPTNLVSE
jgi:hypothetical protein